MYRVITLALLAPLVGAGMAGCSGSSGGTTAKGTPYVFDLPAGFPSPRISVDNPITVEKVALGRHLFYDKRMSINQEGSCATCHEQRKAFTDGRQTSVGPTGDIHPRNAMSLTNVVYNTRQNWANPTLRNLESQAIAVMFNESPVELGWTDNEDEILARFAADPLYQELFTQAYPGDDEPYQLLNVVDAIASFGATLISGRAPLDRDAVDASVRRGEDLFNSERLECFHCHGAFNFAQSVQGSHSVVDTTEYKNNGLYNIAGPGPGYPLNAGNYPTANQGLYEFTGVASDMGRFRAPTLRNIALTAPYMHDGSIASLREVVVNHYSRAGRLISDGEYAGDGANNPHKDPLVQGFVLDEQELTDLLAFFDSLTDWEFICNPEFSDPFGNIPMHESCP